MLHSARNSLFIRRCRHKLQFTQVVPLCSVSEKPGFKLDGAYVPSAVDQAEFECHQYFTPKITSSRPFTMILPPPNITGNLHLGHALTATIQDVIMRWKRMEGIECVWIPGIDHAGIATQVVVEKLLWKETRKNRHEIGREAFQGRVWKWKEEKEKTIENQLRRLGLSLDWSAKVFTMDPVQSSEVTKAFIALFESGLIYRADHLVNWSCTLQSAISDIEVEHIEANGATLVSVPGYEEPVEFGTLTKFAYKIHDADEEIVVATTRPETVFGDVAVAVNPRDERYARYIGRYLWHPFRNETIPIICDDFVDPSFGTGAVKVTPGHDLSDFDVAKRHSLPLLQVIDKRGNLTPLCGECTGMARFLARSVVLSRLESLGLFRDTRRDHKMTVPICSRSKDVVELLVQPQWFIKCSEMAKSAAQAVREGNLVLEPKEFEKVWFHWLDNTRDWCISRQLWWGHRIPVYSCRIPNSPDSAIWIAAENPSQALRKASSRFSRTDIQIEQDNDVLDTWFSSALLPFTVWSQQPGKPIDQFYPLSLMETGHDILFFWVARMTMLCKQLTGCLPFEKILLHGIVCDAQGRKMSKSLGNVVTPEDVIEGSTLENLEAASRASLESGILSSEELMRAVEGQKRMFPVGIPECGTDALRFTLCSHNIKSHFINFDVQECHVNKLFCNKIWQATKYTNNAIEKTPRKWLKSRKFAQLGLMDQWVLSRLSCMVEMCRNGLERNDFHVVTAAIKDFLYFQFCDIYLEATKRAFKASDEESAAGHCWTLTTCLDTALRALAPFMPRLTQHLHTRLLLYPGVERVVDYPKKHDEWRNPHLEEAVAQIMEVTVAIRRMKNLFGIVGKHQPEAFLVGDSAFYEPFKATIQDLSHLHQLAVLAEMKPLPQQDTICDLVGKNTSIHLILPSDLRKSLELDLPKLEVKKGKLIKELERMNKMMAGNNYRVKATEEAQRNHAKKVIALEDKLARINYMQTLSKN